METIFDHNITDEEYACIIGNTPKEKYLRSIIDFPDDSAMDICYLLYQRKYERYKEYLEKLPIEMPLDFGIITSHPL